MLTPIAVMAAALLCAGCSKDKGDPPYTGPVNVYVAGFEYETNNNSTPIATYWKDGEPVTLGTDLSQAYGIFVANGDIYVAGEAVDQVRDIMYAVYWKNGQAVRLVDAAGWSEAKAVFVSGTDVYVAGTATLWPCTGRTELWSG